MILLHRATLFEHIAFDTHGNRRDGPFFLFVFAIQLALVVPVWIHPHFLTFFLWLKTKQQTKEKKLKRKLGSFSFCPIESTTKFLSCVCVYQVGKMKGSKTQQQNGGWWTDASCRVCVILKCIPLIRREKRDKERQKNLIWFVKKKLFSFLLLSTCFVESTFLLIKYKRGEGGNFKYKMLFVFLSPPGIRTRYFYIYSLL